jgi:hypothetical protein
MLSVRHQRDSGKNQMQLFSLRLKRMLRFEIDQTASTKQSHY